MDTKRIAGLLQPFFTAAAPSPQPCHSEQSEESASLSQQQFTTISTYIDILLHWNARMNLTAIRDPEEIVTRHFGESLFAARHLFPSPSSETETHLIDLGSGAGFPGLPIKIWNPNLRVTLIESSQKKSTFLREVIRALTLTNINVFNGRAEDFPGDRADFVTLRAVERFGAALPIAENLLVPGGSLALLIGSSQLEAAKKHLQTYAWSSVPVPQSENRILAIGAKP